jgi:hypothetical protein
MVSDQVKIKLISFSNLFVSAFLLTIAGSIYTMGTIEWTASFWIPILIVGVNAGIAAIVARFTPVKLGGKRV